MWEEGETEGDGGRTAHDALAWSGFHPNLDFAKHDVEFRLDGRRIPFFCNGELGALVSIYHVSSSSVPHVRCGGRGGEIKGRVADSECWVAGTIGLVQRVAARPGLRCGWDDGENGEEGEGVEEEGHVGL